MKRIYASLLILVFLAFAISSQDDQICGATLLSGSEPASDSLFAAANPERADADSYLASLLDQLENADVTEVWLLHVGITESAVRSTVRASALYRNATVPVGRAPPASLPVSA